jgi:hypothetical protein
MPGRVQPNSRRTNPGMSSKKKIPSTESTASNGASAGSSCVTSAARRSTCGRPSTFSRAIASICSA